MTFAEKNETMKIRTTILAALIASTFNLSAQAHYEDRILSMFWNLENFFSCKDDGTGESDHEFSAEGKRHWTSSRFYAKCSAISKALFWTGDSFGAMPDVIGVAEVENREVLQRLLSTTGLRKEKYSIVHYDSPDKRGIDVALLWKRENLELLSSKACYVPGMATRDILLTRMRNKLDGEEMAFIVVHLPSKYGGGKTAWKREKAAERLRQVADSVYDEGCKRIIVMGDFNDVPSAEAFARLGPLLVNVSEALDKKGEGTIRFNGKWNLIDMFWTTADLADSTLMHIVKIPFLMVHDRQMSGEKPLRTYLGPRYAGGVSDHCPVVLEIYCRKK